MTLINNTNNTSWWYSSKLACMHFDTFRCTNLKWNIPAHSTSVILQADQFDILRYGQTQTKDDTLPFHPSNQRTLNAVSLDKHYSHNKYDITCQTEVIILSILNSGIYVTTWYTNISLHDFGTIVLISYSIPQSRNTCLLAGILIPSVLWPCSAAHMATLHMVQF
jgi:hypothetical protein